jgi:hypothetical protein
LAAAAALAAGIRRLRLLLSLAEVVGAVHHGLILGFRHLI